MNRIPTTALRALLVVFCALVATARADEQPVRHDLSVRLDPAGRSLTVRDRVTGPFEAPVRFLLHAGLNPEVIGDGVSLARRPEPDLERHGINGSYGVPLEEYEVTFGEGSSTEFEVRYRGVVHHEIETGGEEYARSFSGTPGLIDERGVVLSAGTAWYPLIAARDAGDRLVRFDLRVLLPEGWTSVSQGRRDEHTLVADVQLDRWVCDDPMDDIYLIAAPFHQFSRAAGAVEAMAFLRHPDANLAAKYLETTAQYLDLYQRLIGPYPYEKFALVENFWETGYGMPSFTLLGPRIIRFPFILHSSYPHEILHNWWGNSVFVDYDEGNWCEGLTAYLADHLVKEGQGRGAEYRRDSLDRYANYVREGKDFPLAQFRSRHSSATEAVGYGKCLMLFHMLRRDLGDDTFRLGLARVYRTHRGKRASFGDLATVFSDAAGRDLTPFFDQWVQRTGAPALSLHVDPAEQRVVVRQAAAEPFRVDVPVAITFAEGTEAEWVNVRLDGREAEVPLAGRWPLRVDVDPQYDVFRRLDRSETPPTFGRLFGEDDVTIVLPSAESAFEADAWRTVATAWSKTDRVRVVTDRDLDELPVSGATWILGRDNRWANVATNALARYGAGVSESGIDFGVASVDLADHCYTVAVPHPADSTRCVGWIGATRADALAGLARKLPHYGKYSYLAFSGSEPTNDAKGQWPAIGSPLIWHSDPRQSVALRLPAREPMGRLAPVFSPDGLRRHVDYLASDELEGRGVGTAGLDKAAEYIAAEFERIGLEPGATDGTFFDRFAEVDGPGGETVTLRNVVGVLRGSDDEWQSQSVVVGAHYDHLGRGWPDVRAGNEGKIHNGADDNASGVSVLIEVAELLAKSHRPRRSVVFVAFSGEEWGRKGSRAFVTTQRPPFEVRDTLAMVNIDGVGRLDGRKLTVLGAGSAYEWPHVAMGIGFTTGVESNPVADDLGASDHRSFHEVGVPAVQLFGGANEDYHRPTDDADKIDLDGMVQTATWLREALVYLTEREEPFRAQFPEKESSARDDSTGPGDSPKSGRRVSLGTMPDYRFTGPGVRVERTLPDTPAAAAGILAGDLLVEIDGKKIVDLRGYSKVLGQYSPGDRIKITVERDGRRVELSAELRAR